MKILWVENHRVFVRLVLKSFLAEHAVTVSPTVAGARQALTAETYDVILLDYDLDDGKGTELLPDIKGLPIVPLLIAASSHAEGNARLLQAGAVGVCSKRQFAQIDDIIAQLKDNSSLASDVL